MNLSLHVIADDVKMQRTSEYGCGLSTTADIDNALCLS